MRLPLTCSTSCVSDCGTRSKTHRSLAAHPKAALFSRTMPESPADTNAVLSINQLLDTAERLAQTQGITELWWRGHSLATWPLTPGVYRNGRDYAYETAVCARFHRKAPTRYSNCPPNTDLSGW